MIRSQMSKIDLWEKYHYESKETICVIGVLILSAKLCRADGHFSEKEEKEILKIIPHETHQKKVLIRILEEAYNDTNPIEYDAKNLKALLENEHPEFLEFIVAVLYRIAHSDHIYSEEEENMILKISQIFDIKDPLVDRILSSTKNIFSFKFSYWSKQNA